MAYYPPVSPYSAGVACKCPRCGQGALYKSYLGLNERCEACGLDFAKADPGDGAIVFVLFIVGFIAVALAFVARFMWYASIGVSFLIAGGAAIILTLAMLRPLKATLIALQFQHKAEEGRVEE